jgi:hypothetical protein
MNADNAASNLDQGMQPPEAGAEAKDLVAAMFGDLHDEDAPRGRP